MESPTALAKRDEDVWIDHTELTLLQLDEIMFPEEQHLLYSEAEIQNHITYQDEHEAYLFNSVQYLDILKQDMEKQKSSPEQFFQEVERRAVILSAYAVRLRAWELYHPSMRSLKEVVRDDRIPWRWRSLLRNNLTARAHDQNSRGALKQTPKGRCASESLDLTIVATLANMTYREKLPKEWLRPFILT